MLDLAQRPKDLLLEVTGCDGDPVLDPECETVFSSREAYLQRKKVSPDFQLAAIA